MDIKYENWMSYCVSGSFEDLNVKLTISNNEHCFNVSLWALSAEMSHHNFITKIENVV